MRKTKIAAALTVAAMLLSGCGGVKADEAVVKNADYSNFIASAEKYLANCSFQGAVLVAKDDTIILAEGFGAADEKAGTLNTAETTFEIGSMSKQMTAAAVLQLAEQGKLSLDDRVDKYFPDFKEGSTITLSNLIHMRSGLRDCVDDVYGYFPADVSEKFDKLSFAGDGGDNSLAEDYFVPYLCEKSFRSKPDTEFYYTNMNFNMLALIIEQVSGMSYLDYMQKNIFDRVGMDSANGDFRGTTSKGYYSDGSSISLTTSCAQGCGSLNGDVYDVFRWNRALMNGTLLKEDSMAEMFNPIDGYGCGVFAGDNTILHGGCTYVFNSYNIIYRNNGVSVTVLENRPIEISDASYISRNLNKLLVQSGDLK